MFAWGTSLTIAEGCIAGGHACGGWAQLAGYATATSGSITISVVTLLAM